MLTPAARHADIIGFSGGRAGSSAEDPLADRVELVKAAAAERFDSLELNLAITAVPTDDSGIPDLTLTRAYDPNESDDELVDMPSVPSGSPRQIADT